MGDERAPRGRVPAPEKPAGLLMRPCLQSPTRPLIHPSPGSAAEHGLSGSAPGSGGSAAHARDRVHCLGSPRVTRDGQCTRGMRNTWRVAQVRVGGKMKQEEGM